MKRKNTASTLPFYALSGYYAGIALKQNPNIIEGGANFPRLNKLIQFFFEELPIGARNDVNHAASALNTGIADLLNSGETIGVDMCRGVYFESVEELVSGLMGFLFGYNKDVGLGGKVCSKLLNIGANFGNYDFARPQTGELLFILDKCVWMATDMGVLANIYRPKNDDKLHHLTITTLHMMFGINSFKLDGRIADNISSEIANYIMQ